MRIPCLLVLGVTGAFCATCATADERDDRLDRCADLESDAKRLECYDDVLRQEYAESVSERQAVAMPPPEPTPSVPVSTEAPAPATEPQLAPYDRFGFDAPPEPGTAEDERDELGANIAEIQVRRNGERIFTLDNGQVWAEKSPSPSLQLEVGDRVTIKNGLFGSHRLFGSGKRSTGVHRVR